MRSMHLFGNEMQLLNVNKMTEAINKKNLTLVEQREVLKGQEKLKRCHNKETKIFLSFLSSEGKLELLPKS